MNSLSFVDFLTFRQHCRQLRSDVRIFKPALLHQLVSSDHRSHGSWVTWVMSHMGHLGHIVTWVTDDLGHESWCHLGHESHTSQVMRVKTHVGDLVMSYVGHLSHESHTSRVTWIKVTWVTWVWVTWCYLGHESHKSRVTSVKSHVGHESHGSEFIGYGSVKCEASIAASGRPISYQPCSRSPMTSL